jgi:hypothetical protein
MTINQIPFGAPPHGGNPLAPIGDAVNSAFAKRRSNIGNMQQLAAHHALSMVRMDKSHEQNKELQTQRIEATAIEGAANRAHKERLQRGQQRHTARMTRMNQAHEMTLATGAQSHALNLENTQSGNRIAELQATMKGIQGLGKGGRVGEFKMGDIHAKFNPFVEKAPAATQSPAPAAPEAPQATSAPAPTQTAKPSLMWNNPTTGRIEKRPEGAPAPVAKKAAAKKGTPRPRKK